MPDTCNNLFFQSPSWQSLIQENHTATLAELFEQEPDRYQRFNFNAAGIQANISRQPLSQQTLDKLLDTARILDVEKSIQAQRQGRAINNTEQRPALHTALRGSNPNLKEESALVNQCLDKMRAICHELHNGSWQGFDGSVITDIVNIGIGGSDLGPRMATEALSPYHSQLKVHYVTNADPVDIESTLRTLTPSSTLFIVTSKSWSTLETLNNAQLAKEWFTDKTAQSNISQHFIAVSTNIERCREFGIVEDHILPMWDWVGGRFSLWSAAGLSIALATSFETFEALLKGASTMDQHFYNTPLNKNLPVILSMVEIWQVNFLNRKSFAVIPYDQSLRLLPDHLQQLTMESNGKSVTRDGKPISYQTAPALWGSAGTTGQHSYHQLFHQGTEAVPIDFILPLSSHSKNNLQHKHMIANCLAQAQTLMDGLSAEAASDDLLSRGYSTSEASALAQHKCIPGNRPSTILSFNKLTPEILGALIALYEHKTFCSSIIWNINAFDQWGVELGKIASHDIYQQLLGNSQHQPTNVATKEAIKEAVNACQ